MRGAYVVNPFVGLSIKPAAISKTTAWKSDELRPCAVDDSELQVAVVRRGIYQVPFHAMIIAHQADRPL